MERICRYRVGGHETPVGVDRLHDLVAERDPIDAINKPGLIHARKRRLAQSKYDFRLDTGLHEVAHSLSGHCLKPMGGPVSAIAPDGRANAVGHPHLAICEADFATDNSFTASLKDGAEQCWYLIGLTDA